MGRDNTRPIFLLCGICRKALYNKIVILYFFTFWVCGFMIVVYYDKVGVNMTTIFRVEKNREFVVMSNKFLREKEMSLKAKGLLALCLALPDDWNYSLNGLCAICKESQTSIRSALKELESFHYLQRNRQQNEKGHFIYEYVIYETPYVENQHTVKQHTEKRHKGNRTQQSNKRQTIKKQNINNGFMDELKELYKDVENNGE